MENVNFVNPIQLDEDSEIRESNLMTGKNEQRGQENDLNYTLGLGSDEQKHRYHNAIQGEKRDNHIKEERHYLHHRQNIPEKSKHFIGNFNQSQTGSFYPYSVAPSNYQYPFQFTSNINQNQNLNSTSIQYTTMRNAQMKEKPNQNNTQGFRGGLIHYDANPFLFKKSNKYQRRLIGLRSHWLGKLVGIDDLFDSSLYRSTLVEFVAMIVFTFIRGLIWANSTEKPFALYGELSDDKDGSQLKYTDPFIPIAIAHTILLTFFIFIFAPSSGAHINPLVTWATAFCGFTSIPRAVLYSIAQFAGCALGSSLVAYVISDYVIDSIGVGNCELGEDINISQGLVVEVIFCLANIITIFGTAFTADQRQIFGDVLTPPIIAAILGLLTWCSSGLAKGYTGAGMNPAMCFGASYATNWRGWDDFITVFFPGALIAAIIHAPFFLTIPPNHDEIYNTYSLDASLKLAREVSSRMSSSNDSFQDVFTVNEENGDDKIRRSNRNRDLHTQQYDRDNNGEYMLLPNQNQQDDMCLEEYQTRQGGNPNLYSRQNSNAYNMDPFRHSNVSSLFATSYRYAACHPLRTPRMNIATLPVILTPSTNPNPSFWNHNHFSPNSDFNSSSILNSDPMTINENFSGNSNINRDKATAVSMQESQGKSYVDNINQNAINDNDGPRGSAPNKGIQKNVSFADC